MTENQSVGADACLLQGTITIHITGNSVSLDLRTHDGKKLVVFGLARLNCPRMTGRLKYIGRQADRAIQTQRMQVQESLRTIVGALTFFEALSLGAVLEHLQMGAGKTF